MTTQEQREELKAHGYSVVSDPDQISTFLALCPTAVWRGDDEDALWSTMWEHHENRRPQNG